MSRYEYRVLPAPNRGQRGPGVRGPEARFAHALSVLMNKMAREGWDYLRAETLPCEERQGLRGKTTVSRSVLVFRRVRAQPGTDSAAATTHRPPQDPEDMAKSAALSLHPEAAPGLGPAPSGTPPRPDQPLGAAEDADGR